MKTELNEAIEKAYSEYLNERGLDFCSKYCVDYMERNLIRMFILCTRGTLIDLENLENLLIDVNNYLINGK